MTTKMNEKYYEIELDEGRGGETTIEADSLEEAIDLAEDWAREGDWDTTEGTAWIDIRVRAEGTSSWTHTQIGIDPVPPLCTRDEHDWRSPYDLLGGLRENPGVWGHGGGVKITTVCQYCGIYRVLDTWADVGDGTHQEITQYLEADDMSTRWIEAAGSPVDQGRRLTPCCSRTTA